MWMDEGWLEDGFDEGLGVIWDRSSASAGPGGRGEKDSNV